MQINKLTEATSKQNPNLGALHMDPKIYYKMLGLRSMKQEHSGWKPLGAFVGAVGIPSGWRHTSLAFTGVRCSPLQVAAICLLGSLWRQPKRLNHPPMPLPGVSWWQPWGWFLGKPTSPVSEMGTTKIYTAFGGTVPYFQRWITHMLKGALNFVTDSVQCQSTTRSAVHLSSR